MQRSTNQVSKQSIKQSISQSTSQSSALQTTSPITTSCMAAFKDRLSFIHLCSFISLHDKLARLQHLDKSIKQLFDVNTCCRNDTLYVMLFRSMAEPFDITLTRCTQQLKLFSSMSRVVIHFEVVPDTHETKKLKQQAKSVRALTHLLNYEEDDIDEDEFDEFDEFDEDDEDEDGEDDDDEKDFDSDEYEHDREPVVVAPPVTSSPVDFDDLPELVDKNMLPRRK